MHVEVRRQWSDVQRGGDVKITMASRWVRLALYYGEAPGSHTGFWRTRGYGLHGWNYRVGSIRRCLTVLVHTRVVVQSAV